MLIAVFLIVLGMWNKEGAYISIGFVFVFFLSVFVFMPGDVEYKTGNTVNVSYVYSGSDVVGSNVVVSDVVTGFDDSTSKWFGRWLAIISGLGFGLTLFEYTKSKKDSEADD